MPSGDGQLAGYDGGAASIAVLEDFKEVMRGLAVEGLKAPIVKDQQLHTAELAQQA